MDPPGPEPSLCSISETLCRAASYYSFQLAVMCWATLQLTWTSLLAVSHLWQISRQMTTFEISNLGRYGYMGGRGGASLRDQSGAMKQATSIGAGIGPSGAGEEGTGGMVVSPDGMAAGHHHSHRGGGAIRAISGPLMKVLGLDRFTKGKAVSGMRRAGKDQNPFDLGIVKVRQWRDGANEQNCQDFWSNQAIDYTRVYDIPPEGWPAYRRRAAIEGGASTAGKKGYQPVNSSAEDQV